MISFLNNALQIILILLCKFWQKFISPLYPPCCRFTPTCSGYMVQALKNFGPLKGGYLGIVRILRCHPFNHDPYEDPVPKEWLGWQLKNYRKKEKNEEI